MMLLADKGRCTVVLDKSTYKSKIMDLLSDVETYEVIPKNPTLKIRGKACGVIRALRSKGLLSKENYFKIYTASEALHRYMGSQISIKLSVPLRPIVSIVGTIVHNIAKFLVQVLAPLAGKTSNFIKDGRDFTNKVMEMVLDPGEVPSSRSGIPVTYSTLV